MFELLSIRGIDNKPKQFLSASEAGLTDFIIGLAPSLYLKAASVAAGGTWLDLSGNSNHATVVADASVGADGLEIPGTGGNATIADAAAFNFGSAGFTLSFWLKQTTNANDDAWLGQYGSSGGNNGWMFWRAGTDGIYFQFTTDATSAQDAHWHVVPSTGVWVHVLMTRTGSNYELFLDGVSQGVATSAGTIYNSTRTMKVGHAYETFTKASKMDNITIYNRMLSNTEIALIFNNLKSKYGVA